MKNIITGCLTWVLILLALSLTACSNSTDKDVLHLGVNAVIIDIDVDKKLMTVNGTDEESFLGENCVISCKDIDIIYCNYKSGEVNQITIEHLQVGDAITLNVKESEVQIFTETQEILNIEQLQLATQRL